MRRILTILALMVIRMLWRIGHRPPPFKWPARQPHQNARR